MSRPDSWMPLHIQDWRRGTLSFTATERGAYMELLLAYWELGPLPAEDSVLEGLAKCRGKEWKQAKAKVLAKFYEEDGTLYHERADKERAEAATRYSKRALAGKRGGEAKAKQKPSNATAAPEQPPTTTLHNTTDVVPPTAGAGSAVDPAKWVYDVGKQLLKTYDVAAKQAGGLITAWLKRLGPEQLLAVIANAGQQRRHDIVAYIEGSIRSRTNGRNHDASEQQRSDREAILAAFGHRVVAPDGDHPGNLDGGAPRADVEPPGARVTPMPARGTDDRNCHADAVRPDVQHRDSRLSGIGGRVPDEARAPVGGHPRQSNRRDHGELEVGQPDADAGGHPGLSTASYHAPDDAPGQGGNSPTEAENTDGLDIPDFLKRGLAASGAHD